MSTNLAHIKPGDFLATKKLNRSRMPERPDISHEIWVVERETATQLHARNISSRSVSISVRKTDGKVIGENYMHAFVATSEILEEHRAQSEELARYQKANAIVNDLIGKELHQLKLNTKQLEALAKAWVEIKAMASDA